jgi:hypothetical protein
MNIEEFATRIRVMLDARQRPVAGAIFSFALVEAENGFVLATGRWEFADSPVEIRESRDYPGLKLAEEWFPGETAFETLLEVLRGNRPLSSVYLPTSSLFIREGRFRTSLHSYTGWPEHVFEISVRGTNPISLPYDPVAKKGLPPLVSGVRGIGEWVWKEQYGDNHDFPFREEIAVLLPDSRGRVRNADWNAEGLSIQIDSDESGGPIELQLRLTGDHGTQFLSQAALDGTDVFVIPPDVSIVYVYLVHEDDTLLNFFQLNRGQHLTARAGSLSVAERAEIDLRAGESDEVEYKPFIEPSDAKESQLVETIVAFANTRGGRLYVGVCDDGTPQEESHMRKAGKGAVQEASQLLMQRLRELGRDRIKPVPPLVVEQVRVFGKLVIVASVAAGVSRPYSTTSNDVFIRKGGSNMKPDPLTELPALYDRARRSGLLTAPRGTFVLE